MDAATPDWSALPVPADDGAARHLAGMRLPSVPLPATDGSMVDLSALPGRVVVYAYPRTADPEGGSPDGWDAIPGARGCTPQSCAFRDHFTELQALGVSRLFGLSTQTTAYQQEAASRLHLPIVSQFEGRLLVESRYKALSPWMFALRPSRTFRRLVLDSLPSTAVVLPELPPGSSVGCPAGQHGPIR